MERQTWYRDTNLVTWSYFLPLPKDQVVHLDQPDFRRKWITEQTKKLLHVMEDFAIIEKAYVSVYKGKEFVLKSPKTLISFLKETVNVNEVDMVLTLRCIKPDSNKGQEVFHIKEGAGLTLEIELDDHERLYFEKYQHPIHLMFSLHVDIYSPVTESDIEDNSILAGLNGPLLSTFLKRIEEDTPFEFDEFDSQGYKGVVGRYGFEIPRGN